MRALLILPMVAVLAACATPTPQKEVVVQHNYVVRTASEQQKALPPNPPPIDVATADQIQLAEWIVQSEGRMLTLESIIKRLIEFYERPVTADERKKAEGEPKKAEGEPKKAEGEPRPTTPRPLIRDR